MGRGIEKIKDSCAEAGNPMPEYVVNSIPMRILKVIRDNPTLSQSQIAEMLGEKHDTIKYHMRKIRLSGIIKRVGSNQKGKWIDSRKVN